MTEEDGATRALPPTGLLLAQQVPVPDEAHVSRVRENQVQAVGQPLSAGSVCFFYSNHCGFYVSNGIALISIGKKRALGE